MIINSNLPSLRTKVLNDELKIKNEFLKADKMIVSQLEALQRHPDAKYKSQLEEDEIISLQFETPQRDPYASQLILNLF
ncbi:6062_t:CDS:2 [Racocetra fulgida]|uniref:6062_t:CDS:1 n=1 Tax=Racocetra fulgida TaxID=60492 RepID=A0A9N9AAI1_9GLOM|nr:6062_t:CDS:2 [Racocetra fulgida]